MRINLTTFFMLAVLALSLSACLVRTRGRTNNNRRVVSCGKHESWNGDRCVRRHDNGRHNGNRGRGPVVRDHRK